MKTNVSAETHHGVNGLSTLKDWAGLSVMVMYPHQHTVSDFDPTDLLREPSYKVELPSLVMGESFQFAYDAKQVLAELHSLQAECARHPGCVIKWVRNSTTEEVNSLWRD